MIARLEARAWQVGAIGGGIVAAALALALGLTVVQRIGLERDVARLETQLEAKRGDLDACRRNTRTLEDTVNAQNGEIELMGLVSKARLSAAEKVVAEARASTAAAQSRLNRLLNAPATGATVCERLDEVDHAVLESLK